MNTRLAATKELARSKNCSHMLVSDPIDVEYISGFRASNAFLLISDKTHLLFTDFRYRDQAAGFCGRNPQWRFVESAENGFAVIGENVPAGARVGIQSASLTVDQFDCIRTLWKQACFGKLGDDVARISSVKTAAEIASMRSAAKIADTALAALAGKLHTGITERDAASILEEECRRLGSEGPSFPTIVLFGQRTSLPHGHPTGVKLKNGDWILCDFGCTKNGLCSDMTRTMVMGKASDKQKLIYETVRLAQKAGRNFIKPGVLCSQVDDAARSVITASGFGKAFGHATGHGVGRRIHEKPRVGARDKTVLSENMVITVEPGIYLPRFGGVRIEDMVAVTGNGCRILTGFTKNLVEIA